MSSSRVLGCVATALGLLLSGAVGWAQERTAAPTIKTEHFDHDPGWESLNNRVQPKHVPTVTQDFGYRPGGKDGQTSGAIGGRVTRSSKPAYYADKIGIKTLKDTPSASG